MLLLNDLLKLSVADIERAKIKFNQYDYNGVKPLDVFLHSSDEINDGWLFWRAERRNFNVGELALNFVQFSRDTWLFTTIKEVTEELDVINGKNYNGRELSEYSHLYGRVIVKYLKDSRSSVRKAAGLMDLLIVEQILPTVYDGEVFPGYDNVRLSFMQLENIVARKKADWVAALENQKAVYLITDNNSGKLYVGSAYGDNGMLLARWSNYVDNGHGGNKLLQQVEKELGFAYIKQNFQYAILENYNARVDKNLILSRETWWKETLGSRAFGLNAN